MRVIACALRSYYVIRDEFPVRMATKDCSMCSDFSAPTFQLLLHHINRVHGNSPDFNMVCGIELDGDRRRCETTFTNFHAYKRHIRKKHRLRAFDDVTSSEVEDSSETMVVPTATLDSELNDDAADDENGESTLGTEQNCDFDKETAIWILKLKEGRKLTQSAMEEILSDVTELCTDMVTRLGHDVCKILESAGVNMRDIPELDVLLSDESPYAAPFCNLKSQFLQHSYYRNHLNFVVRIWFIYNYNLSFNA